MLCTSGFKRTKKRKIKLNKEGKRQKDDLIVFILYHSCKERSKENLWAIIAVEHHKTLSSLLLISHSSGLLVNCVATLEREPDYSTKVNAPFSIFFPFSKCGSHTAVYNCFVWVLQDKKMHYSLRWKNSVCRIDANEFCWLSFKPEQRENKFASSHWFSSI